jgi:hypothetical protein
MQPGCKNAVVGTSNISIILTPPVAAGTAVTILATLTVTASGSALAPSPSAVTVLCTKSGSTYSAGVGTAVTVNVTSPAYNGTPFSVNTTAQTVNSVVETALPAWLSASGGGAASAGREPGR